MGMLIVKSNQELMAEEAAKEELSAEVKKIETQPLSEGLRVELASHIRMPGLRPNRSSGLSET